jgi:hypothetical protein
MACTPLCSAGAHRRMPPAPSAHHEVGEQPQTLFAVVQLCADSSRASVAAPRFRPTAPESWRGERRPRWGRRHRRRRWGRREGHHSPGFALSQSRSCISLFYALASEVCDAIAPLSSAELTLPSPASGRLDMPVQPCKSLRAQPPTLRPIHICHLSRPALSTRYCHFAPQHGIALNNAPKENAGSSIWSRPLVPCQQSPVCVRVLHSVLAAPFPAGWSRPRRNSR